MTERIINYLKKHTWLLYAFFAFLQLLFMFYQGGKQSMWLDEMSLMGTITRDKGIRDILWQYLTVDVTNLPLFPLISALWYRIFPANDRLMLLLTELFSSGALFVTALLAERNFGKREGILSAILMLISLRPVINCGFEFRSYAFMLFFSALVLYFYYEKNRSPGKREEILYGASLILLIFTHYSGIILIGILGLFDLIKIIMKKQGVSGLLTYIASGILFLPWFVLMLRFKEKSIGSFWVDPPTVPEIARTLKYLLSNNEAIYVIFIFGIVITAAELLFSAYKRDAAEGEALLSAEMLGIIFIMILSVFLYSAYINPRGGFFLKRYFIVLLPLMVCTTSYAVRKGTEFFSSGKDAGELYRLFFVISGFILIYFGFINLSEIREKTKKSSETFREAAAYVREQGILSEGDNTALICSVNPRAAAGFCEYYVRRGGRDKEINTVSLQGEEPVKELTKYDKLYLVYVHRDLEDLDPLIEKTLREDYEITALNEDVKAAVYERKH